jgi:S-adenosylhomocysteine hydrolase
MNLNHSLYQKFFIKPSLAYLPILEKLIDHALMKKQFSLRDIAIVYVHHPLKTSVNLIDSMVRLGAMPKNIFVLGKKYSECETVVQQITRYGVHYQPCSTQIGLGQYNLSFTRDINLLWKKVSDNLGKDIKKLLILDHGGYATSFIPVPILKQYKVIAVEKTTAGLIKFKDQGLPPFPLISVADCAAKKILESPLIAETIINKLLTLIPKNPDTAKCGIIGFGAIGKAIVIKLLSMNYKVMIYDRHFQSSKPLEGVTFTDKFNELVEFSDYIFGCTGREAIKTIEPFVHAEKDKTLISCSSEDKEFLPLLKAIQRKNNKLVQDPFVEVRYITAKGATIRILKGGFPVNFDHSGESVPPRDIQLTRALALTSIIQAIQFFNKKSLLNKAGIYALDAKTQQFLSNEWLETQPVVRYSQDIIRNFKDLDWIIKNSGGAYEPCSIIESLPNNTTLSSEHPKLFK